MVMGGAGFIGSHMVDALMKRGEEVCVLDNLSTGFLENIKHWIGSPNFTFIKGEASKIPTPEDYAPLKPIPIYDASKLACEALTIAYAVVSSFKKDRFI